MFFSLIMGRPETQQNYAMESATLIALITTFFFVSVTPGMCMTLALTLGMTIGLRRTMWMMLGELLGVGSVIVLSMLGVAAMVLQYPQLFMLLKLGGGAYLLYLGVQLWRSRGKLAIDLSGSTSKSGRWQLISQGFVTAIANPKGWAFFIALLPPFIDLGKSLLPQLSLLVMVILVVEFLCLMGYALGGKSLGKLLQHSANVRLLNRIAGTLMVGVAVWLVIG